MLEEYRRHVAERAQQGIVPLPLSPAETKSLTELLLAPPAGEEELLLDLLGERVPPGVDAAAYVKAEFLGKIARGELSSPLVSKERAVELLGTMLGGYNVAPLVGLLEDAGLGELAATQLEGILLVADAFDKVVALAKGGNDNAKRVLQSWADGEWFSRRPTLPETITLTVFKVSGETNTDDLSP
ncbi:MAG: aconitate hydratase B, partial [Myxococcales bacterium]|nr:aconitate hydratase B [Myxococcales bacterium]